ncbi:MAG: hypothetical protein MPJ50_10770, partial [Pirellulales bacterium]|nr:hypothetical protein [Pirellulales bacterium]
PSFWVVRLGEMRFTLGLSGWTANDWTGGTALDALLPPVEVDTSVADKIAHSLQSHRQATLADLQATGADDNEVFAILMRLARNGQAIFDLGAELFRWRQILPAPVDWAQLEETSPERAGAKAIIRDRQVSINRCDRSDTGIQISGLSGGRDVEIRIDADGRLTGGKCNCSHHFRNGLRKGPCRHLLALYQLNAAQREDAKERASIWSSFIFVRNSAR